MGVTLSKYLDVSEMVVKTFWQAALVVVRKALIEGHTVVLEEVATITPYVKPSRKYYNSHYGKERRTPVRNYVRFKPSVTLVAALRKKPVKK